MTSQSDVSEYVFIRTFEESNEYPLSNSLPLLLCIILAYLLIVLKIGPDFMKNREPYKLKNTILVYNAAQVLLSASLIYYGIQPILKKGLFPKRCCEEDPETRRLMFTASSVYIFAKVTELIETFFFILRKKFNQVSFLHVYHHTTVILGGWVMFKYSMNQTSVYAGFINAIVHVTMYFYYFMAALGPQYQKYLTWKKHLTTFQLVQFVTVVLHQIISIAYTSCKHSFAGIAYVILSCMVFYGLFYDFYKKSYKGSKKTAKHGIQNGAKNEVQNGANNGVQNEAKNGIHNEIEVKNKAQ